MRRGTHSLRKFMAGLCLLALAGCASAVPDNTADKAANAAYFAADYNCLAASSGQIDLKSLNADATRYMEKCIRLEAFSDGTALYVNAGGMKPVKDSTVGLYWKEEDVAKHLKLGPSFVVITGRLRDCAKHNAMTAQAALDSAPGAVPAQPAILGACKSAATAIFISDAQIIPTAMD